MVGERFTAEVGPIAHGGHCIVRVPTGTAAGGSSPVETRVVFTRHCLPGETVVLEITEGTEGDRFWRGDAVEILTPSPDRVPAPCPYAGPGLCGGCDFQHVALPRQRLLKADVVREQLTRLGGLPADDPLVRDLVVEAVPTESVEPGRDDGLHWRTRMQYVDLPDGRRGMRAHRSQHVVPIDECLIAHPSADERRHGVVTETVGEHDFHVEADGFWQVHPGAPAVLVDSVLEALAPQPGEKVLDLYAGVGLFAAFLADRVGESGRVVAVEGDRTACAHAMENLRAFRHARVEPGSVERVLATAYDEPFDLVVLDPPREGARRAVVEQVADRAPRAVAYVACDPAALARDVRSFAELGYRLTALRAFDLFPMTSHVECVALLEKTGPDLRRIGTR
jgi:tRNA/tmRNA/rRNA uracil-C5-methylase (TrmA/RlmC/RlmD family)